MLDYDRSVARIKQYFHANGFEYPGCSANDLDTLDVLGQADKIKNFIRRVS